METRSGMATSVGGLEVRRQGHIILAGQDLIGEVKVERLLGGEYDIPVLEAQAECNQNLALGVHPAVQAFFDAVNRSKRYPRLAGKL